MFILLQGCLSSDFETQINLSSLKNPYEVVELQDMDASLCSGLSGARDSVNVSLKLQIYDADTGKSIEGNIYHCVYLIDQSFLSLDTKKSSAKTGHCSDLLDSFWCSIAKPNWAVSLSVELKDYISVDDLVIDPLQLDKMYLIKLYLKKKPDCFFEENNLDYFFAEIKKGFDLDSFEYTLECINSHKTHGGFVEGRGKYYSGDDFEFLYREGACSSGGNDCGFTSCFSVEDNDRLFEKVKEHICHQVTNMKNEESSRKKCFAGEFDYVIGRKKVISVKQVSSGQNVYAEKSSSDCLSIY